MKKALFPLTVVSALLAAPASFAVLVNPGFAPEAAFTETAPPTGWMLRDQEARALVSRAGFAFSGENVFRFEELQRGFGANKLEQCVPLNTAEDFDFGIWLRTPTPSADMALRLNVEFYANQTDCTNRDDRNGNIGNDDYDFDLDIQPNVWTRFGSDSYAADDLEDAGSIAYARISYRVRDRSGLEGEPAFPLTQVYLDGAWANGSPGPVNASFDEVSYPTDLVFAQGSGPLGWDIRDVAGQALVSQVDFARSNGTVFWFNQLERGFGDNKLDQCVPLPAGTTESTVSAWVMTMSPNDDLRVRFASEFYDNLGDCLTRENQIGERFDTDIRINESVVDEGEWGRIESDPVVLAEDLPETPSYLRVSIRARDRSDGGEPGGLVVFFDDIETNLVNPQLTGAWYDPASAGQGFNLQLTTVGLFGYYYGYHNGEQLWLQLGIHDGPIVFGQPIDVPVFAPSGGTFGQPDDPTAPPVWGRLVTTFESCTSATATLTGNGMSQTFELDLLATIDGLQIPDCTDLAPSAAPVQLSAAWFDPATAGQGWNFLYAPNGLFGYFYGYDAAGAPLWLATGNVPVAIGETVTLDLFYGQGGTFTEPVAPANLETWGTAEVTFSDCRNAEVSLTGVDGDQAQSITVLVLTEGLTDC